METDKLIEKLKEIKELLDESNNFNYKKTIAKAKLKQFIYELEVSYYNIKDIIKKDI